jgi:hypothetical protein
MDGIAVGTKNLEDDGDRDRLETSLSLLSTISSSPPDLSLVGAATALFLSPWGEALGAVVVALETEFSIVSVSGGAFGVVVVAIRG